MCGNDFESLNPGLCPFLSFLSVTWSGAGHPAGVQYMLKCAFCRIYGISLLNDGTLSLGKGRFWGGRFCLQNILMKLQKRNLTSMEIDLRVIKLSFPWSWHSWWQWKDLGTFLQFGETETHLFLTISFNKYSGR